MAVYPLELRGCELRGCEYAEGGSSCTLWRSSSGRRRLRTVQVRGSQRQREGGRDRKWRRMECHAERAAAPLRIRARILVAGPTGEPATAKHLPATGRMTVFRCFGRRSKASLRRIVCGNRGDADEADSGIRTEASGPPRLCDVQPQARLAHDACQARGFGGE